jgi:predicted acylesterase/phospholipase RssA
MTGKRVPYLPGRKWVDGSVTHDLPSKRLSRLYGVNHHIVSQANPLITPFASDVTPGSNAICGDPACIGFDAEGVAQRQYAAVGQAAATGAATAQLWPT